MERCFRSASSTHHWLGGSESAAPWCRLPLAADLRLSATLLTGVLFTLESRAFLMSFFTQIVSMAWFNLRSLPERKATGLTAAIGIAVA